MESAQDFQQHYESHGLAKTIEVFDDYVYQVTHQAIWPCYSYLAHAILDDQNMDDGYIENALTEEHVNEHIIQGMHDIANGDFDFDLPIGEGEWMESWQYWQTDTWKYWAILWGTDLIIEFLKWMLTIPEDDRYADWPWMLEGYEFPPREAYYEATS